MAQIATVDITAPPNSLFQGISTNYQDNLTYAEFLLGVLKKLNEMIATVNEHSAFIDNYEGQIEEMQKELAQFRTDWERYQLDLEADVTAQIEAFKREVYAELYGQISQMRAYIDVQDNALRDYIDQVALGQINLYDPTSGTVQPLQTVINNLYDQSRENAITASEYDALELTATYYDGLDIKAYEYDTNAKALLIGG